MGEREDNRKAYKYAWNMENQHRLRERQSANYKRWRLKNREYDSMRKKLYWRKVVDTPWMHEEWLIRRAEYRRRAEGVTAVYVAKHKLRSVPSWMLGRPSPQWATIPTMAQRSFAINLARERNGGSIRGSYKGKKFRPEY